MRAFLLLLPLLLAGCDQKAMFQRFIPKEDDAFAREFIARMAAGRLDAAQEMVDPALRSSTSAVAGFQALSEQLFRGEPLRVDTIGANVFHGGEGVRSNMSYQVQFKDRWIAGNVVVQRGSPSHVIGTRFDPIPGDLEALNRFELAGKTPRHYAMLAGVCLAPIVVLFAAVRCWRAKPKRRWLWLLFVLTGIMQVQLNWTTGEYRLLPFSFLGLAAAAMKMGPYAPWILSLAFPLGALVFLGVEDKLDKAA